MNERPDESEDELAERLTRLTLSHARLKADNDGLLDILNVILDIHGTITVTQAQLTASRRRPIVVDRPADARVIVITRAPSAEGQGELDSEAAASKGFLQRLWLPGRRTT